jgi:hypothetical protein
MNAYFTNITPEEKANILDKHKTVYDGFATNYAQPNQQPLYVQDYANDKGGITVSNKNNVTTYKNMYINEDVYSGMAYDPEETFESLDMIGDGPDDLEYGTFGQSELEDCQFCNGVGRDEFNDEECEWCVGTGFKDNSSHHYDIEVEPEFSDIKVLDLEDDLDDEMIEPLQEQVNKSLDMFRRFNNI